MVKLMRSLYMGALLVVGRQKRAPLHVPPLREKKGNGQIDAIALQTLYMGTLLTRKNCP
jgi:hypothetical protein